MTKEELIDEILSLYSGGIVLVGAEMEKARARLLKFSDEYLEEMRDGIKAFAEFGQRRIAEISAAEKEDFERKISKIKASAEAAFTAWREAADKWEAENTKPK
jgi:AcrR family transcriptional regulator